MILPRNFYLQDTLTLAKKLLGTLLVSDLPQGKCVGRIVETESYLYNDPAAHAYRGITPRNRVLFGKSGFSYVYFIYGMYYCINVSSAREGIGEAVLIRALEPVGGIELMQQRRHVTDPYHLTSGPGKLAQALGINLALNGIDLTKNGPLHILSSGSYPKTHYTPKNFETVVTTRIGIRQAREQPFRFYIKNSPFVSRP